MVQPSWEKTCLVLGGGGLKGLAHVGVLQVLEERGRTPGQVIGSSIGALIAAAWCSGTAANELADLALQVTRRDLFRVAHRNMALKRMRSPGLYQRRPMMNLILGLLGDLKFSELERPLLVNSVDLNSGEQTLWGSPGYDDVPVADAVYASCALPGYLPPQRIRGRFYADGASVSNLPIEAAAELGSELVLAVDVGSTVPIRADMERAGFAAVYARAIEIAIQTMRDVALKNWSTPPVLLIRPAVASYSMFTFDHNDDLIRAGYQAATESIDSGIPPSDGRGVYPRMTG